METFLVSTSGLYVFQESSDMVATNCTFNGNTGNFGGAISIEVRILLDYLWCA